MLKQKSGAIAFVLSEAAQGSPPAFMASYVSAKYAALGLAKALESELSPRGVRVHCVFPPMTETDFIKDFPRPLVDAAREARPDKRLASPQEAARAVAKALGLVKRGAGKS
jgi:NAD(P)-dependent dehydrogenase (short-subunit alcohol dehydrogenase family)